MPEVRWYRGTMNVVSPENNCFLYVKAKTRETMFVVTTVCTSNVKVRDVPHQTTFVVKENAENR